jgi:predicted metalloprotease with PDZ domain
MKKFLLCGLITVQMITQTLAGGVKPPKAPYRFSVDLTKTDADKLNVNLIVPSRNKKEVVYYMPKIVPGTYANYDFGRFVSNFEARDKKGRLLPVEQLDPNSWRIKSANTLNRISYTVEDTWDSSLPGEFVFEPGGTNIEENKNFILNPHGFFGYIDDQKRTPYEVNITRPADFFGSTSLTTAKSSGNTDTYYVGSYNELVDAPIMYNRPDTTTLKIGGADILVSVYSPNKVLSSKDVAKTIGPMLDAQKKYLGGTLPIQKYAFLIYLFDKPTASGKMGALEHSYSSMYCLPEGQAEQLAQTVRDVASHEFFHILTPLSIHSEQIHDFNFNQPEMSKHLWLYEGVTEYFAGHMQVTQGLIDLNQYAEMILEKLFAADQYDQTLPFTEMSKHCLDKHKDQYDNVYQKGALIGLALDIRLRQLSGGKYGLQQLMADLAKQYGKDKPFRDEELFDQIAKITFPEIRSFFARYVEGTEPLPLQETFGSVGITYKDKMAVRAITLGNIQLGYNPDNQRIIVAATSQLNDFGRKMGYQDKDELVSINGQPLTVQNAQQVLTDFRDKTKEGDLLEIMVARKDDKGKEKLVKLSQKVEAVESEQKHVFMPDENASEAQIALRKAWLMQ